MNRFETLCQQIKAKRNLTASHKTRLERLTALHGHVSKLEAELAATDDWPYYKRAAVRERLAGFKPPSFFLEALETLAIEVKDF